MSNLYDFLNFIFKEDKERYGAVYGKDWENKVNDGYDIRDEDGKGITDTEHAKWQVHQSTPKPDDHKYSGDIWNWHQNVPTSAIEAGETTPHPDAESMGFGGEKFPGTNLARYLGHNESEDDFEPGKVHLTSRDARWVYLADDTADKDDAPEDIDDKGESEDALGTIESDTDFHIKPCDDLQSHIMKEIFKDLGGQDFLEDIAVSDITLRHQTPEKERYIEELGGHGGNQKEAATSLSGFPAGKPGLIKTPWVLGFEMDYMDEDLNGADVGLSDIENLDEEWENTNQSRVEADINEDREAWAEDQLDSIYQDTGYDSWYDDKFEDIKANGGRVDNERYQQNIPSFEEFQAERLRGDEFPSYEEWKDEQDVGREFPDYDEWKEDEYQRTKYDRESPEVFPSHEDWQDAKIAAGTGTTFEDWLEENKQSIADNFREGRDLDEAWDNDRILERIPDADLERQYKEENSELDEWNYDNEKTEYLDANEERLREAYNEDLSDHERNLDDPVDEDDYNDSRDEHIRNNKATEQDYEESIPDLWEEWNQERTEQLNAIKQNYKAPKISHVQIRRTASRHQEPGREGYNKSFDILTHWKNEAGEWKLHRKLTKIPHNELKDVLAKATGESRFNDMRIRKSLQKLSSEAMSALAGWWLGGDIQEATRRMSEPTAAQQREFERQIQRAMRKKDKNISKSEALQKLQLFFSTQTDNNDTYVRRKPLENAVTQPDSEEELLKILGMPPFAGARFDPTSHRWTKPENFGQTYAARGGKKRIRGSGTGAHQRSVSGHGKGRIRGEGAGRKFKGETDVAASRRKAHHRRQRKA